jgi:hypothetical protein
VLVLENEWGCIYYFDCGLPCILHMVNFRWNQKKN